MTGDFTKQPISTAKSETGHKQSESNLQLLVATTPGGNFNSIGVFAIIMVTLCNKIYSNYHDYATSCNFRDKFECKILFL